MIRILVLDLGDTLIRDNVVLPHVTNALEAMGKFETGSGDTLSLCLVSDFKMPTPPPTEQKIKAIFKEYRSLLDQLGLTKFFEPVDRHITLSTHAGVRKPDRRIFELAVERLGLMARLQECLFITENPDHIAACRALGMSTLQFGELGAAGADFSEWSEAPLLVAHLVAPNSGKNMNIALSVRLAAMYGLELVSMDSAVPSTHIHGRAKKWQPATNPDRSEGESICVPLPVDVDIELDQSAHIRSVRVGEPDRELLNEAAAFIETLEANRQIAHGSNPMPPGATHQLVTDEKGQTRLVRRRFTAI